MLVHDILNGFTMCAVFCSLADWRTANAAKGPNLRRSVPLSSNTPKNSGIHEAVPPETTPKKKGTETTMSSSMQTASVASVRLKKSAPSGIFADLVFTDRLFIDKSSFIYDFMHHNGKVFAISRPRKWGKTLILDMLNEFFNINANFLRFKEHKQLAIMNSTFENFTEIHMNKYPLIYINLGVARGPTFDGAWNLMKKIIADIFKKFQYLINGNDVNEWDKKSFMEIISLTANDATYIHSIGLLSELILQHHGVGPIILIDEADAMPASAILGGYSKLLNGNFLNFFLNTLKFNVPPVKILVLSVLPVFRMILLAYVNNVDTYTIQDKEFNSVFGFTRGEVEKLMLEPTVSSKSTINEISQWYNQIRVGGQDMYNPKSVKACLEKHGKLKVYTTHFSGSLQKVTKTILTAGGLLPLIEFEILLKEGVLNKTILPFFELDDILQDLDSMWTYCFHAGFIAEAGPSMIKPAGFEIQKLLSKTFIPKNLFSDIIDHELLFKHVRARNVVGVRGILVPLILRAGRYLMQKTDDSHVSIYSLNNYLETIFRHSLRLHGVKVKTKLENLERDIAVKFTFQDLTFSEKISRALKGPFVIMVLTRSTTRDIQDEKDYADYIKIGSDFINIVKGGVYLWKNI